MDWRVASATVHSRWADRVRTGEMTAGSAARYLRVYESFARYAAVRGLDSNVESPELCLEFVRAALPGRATPSQSTQRFRLTVVRHGFHVLREAGLILTDPTSGMRVDWRVGQPELCPLTPAESQRLRAAGRTRVGDTLRPAVVAVAISGASHREIAESVMADVDVQGARLQLGHYSGVPRWVPLDPQAATALALRIAAQRQLWRRRGISWDPKRVPLAMARPAGEYPANSVAPSVSANLSLALQRAGIRQVGVRPRSVREYAANRTYALTGRVEDVAQVLGLFSLDTAARYIDSRWQEQWAPTVQTTTGADG